MGSQPNIPFKDGENIDLPIFNIVTILPIFNIVTIANATNNFSVYDKIEGGFGLVYKETLRYYCGDCSRASLPSSRFKADNYSLASNVLLDNEMNPKISSFDIARAFGGDQVYKKTRRVIGTSGYIARKPWIEGNAIQI
ncbi:unnamed protein product [Camellia sinensis]